MTIRVVIIDDHPLLREGLRSTLQDHPDITIVGEAATGQEGMKLVRECPCEVVILDISLPDISGIDLLKQLIAERPQTRVLVLSTYPEKQYAARSLRAGALAYVTKDSTSTELVAAIRAVAEGRRYLSSEIASLLVDAIAPDEKHFPHDELSDREFEVFCLLGRGMTVQQIAEALTLSPPTVYTYRARIFFKTGMTSTPEIIRYVIEHNLLAVR